MKYLVVLFLCISNFVSAQQEKTLTHKVTKGENIFQIAKAYNITPSDIYKVNPGTENGVQENQIIIVPNNLSISYNLKKADTPIVNSQIKHLVLSKETLYSISKQYNVDVENLEKTNEEVLKLGLQEGQTLIIPEAIKVRAISTISGNKNNHQVQAKETLFSIARQYNVSVQDLDNSNTDVLKDGLQIGENIVIPNKKKTLNGQARIINTETIFHIVEPKETKYSIAKKYAISIEQLETQNPEIINGLIEGNKLAINVKQIKPKNDNEELMIALAEKQAAIEKNKAKTVEIEDLQDKLIVQKQMNQKVLKVNSLKVNLNEIDETKGGSAQKLKLVLEANKNIQEILISKLDSLVVTMGDDLEMLKNKDIDDLEESKKAERDSYKNIGQTNEMLMDLKKDLADNRKIYTGLMNKVQRINLQENHEYKKKVNENQKIKNNPKEDVELLEVIKKIQTKQEENEKRNKQLFTKIDSLGVEKNAELKRRISKATFYSSEARDYDDKLAQAKLKRYQKNALETNKNLASNSQKKPSAEEIRKSLKDKDYNENKAVKIEVLNNLKDVEEGFYLIADAFPEAGPRDAFAKQLTDLGEVNTGFFYNINIFKYYVFTKKLKNADESLFEYNIKKENPLYKNMFIVQIQKE
ncbi:LysM peptidoglycan-binding domain-containing protein [Flavobacterium sp.]|uniref:lytic transglycosylase n=1 Tax=Flavobacterium sp. TaxID=239 RepID=UPI00374DD312